MAHNNQVSAQDAGRALRTVPGSEPNRLSGAVVDQSERDKRRETIGRDDFLQLRLPLAGLLNDNEIEKVLDTACENNPRYEGEHQAREVALGRGFTVYGSQRPHPALKRQVRTRRKVSPWQAAVPTVPEEEDEEGEDEEDVQEGEEINTKTKRSKFTWKFGFKFFGGKDGRGNDDKREAEPQSTSAPASLNRFA